MEQVKRTDGRKDLATLPAAELLRACAACLHAIPKRGTLEAKRLGKLLIEGYGSQMVVSATNSAILSCVKLDNVLMGVKSFRVAVDANALILRLNPAVRAKPTEVVTLYIYDQTRELGGERAAHTYDGLEADAENQYGCMVFFGFSDDAWFGVQDESANYPKLPDVSGQYGPNGGEGKVSLTLETLERLVKSARAAKADFVTLVLHGETKPIYVKGLAKDASSVMWEGMVAPTKVY